MTVWHFYPDINSNCVTVIEWVLLVVPLYHIQNWKSRLFYTQCRKCARFVHFYILSPHSTLFCNHPNRNFWLARFFCDFPLLFSAAFNLRTEKTAVIGKDDADKPRKYAILRFFSWQQNYALNVPRNPRNDVRGHDYSVCMFSEKGQRLFCVLGNRSDY